jgi:hypothetical protein
VGIPMHDIKLSYRDIITKTEWYWHKNRQVDTWNEIENPYISPYIYSRMILNKCAKNICWRKDSLFNKLCWENWLFTCRRLKPDPYLSPCTKI